MGAPLVPPPGWEELGDRPFSFYPAILNIAHNEWRYISATWSEVQVRNTKSGEDIWMPRAYLGAISQVDEPAVIVGLRKEVEWRAGAIVPHIRRVLEMPRAVNGPLPLNTSPEPAPVVSIRLESPTERRIGRMLTATLVAGVVGCVSVVGAYRSYSQRVSFHPVLQTDPGLTTKDDAAAVIRHFGQPESVRWSAASDALQFQILRYPAQNLEAVLMGPERSKVFYIGTRDLEGRPTHALKLPSGGDTASILRSLR